MDNSFRFLGLIEPDQRTGRWVWPFATMEVGDWFLVRQSQRDPEKLRVQVAVRGTNLMRRFGVSKNDPDNPGMIKVWRKPNWEPPKLRKDFDYQGLKALLAEQYGLDADELGWHYCVSEGDSVSMPAKRKAKDERSVVRAKVGDVFYAVQLWNEAICIERLSPTDTLDDWLERQLDAVMS